MADSTLQAIQTKVRRLTRALSVNQLSNDDLNQYINTFVLYDFPEHLRLFNLKTTFEFFTNAYQDIYRSSDDPTNPLYNFNQLNITVHPPIYVAGYQALFLEDRTKFFGIYPMLNAISLITNGDGVTTEFTGVINTQQVNTPGNATQNITLLRNNVLFDSIDNNNNTLSMIDYQINAYQGNLYVPGGSPTSTTVLDPSNNINYINGQYTVTFNAAPQSGIPINSQTVPVQTSIPQTVLFYDGYFQLRPVPDQAYRINMEVFKRPTELLSTSQSPQLQEWWQYIAYGAAKKIFEDRMDIESVQMIMPEFKKQENLINRRTIVQQTSQRTSTIYTENDSSNGAAGSGWGFGGGLF